ncbi:holocytochrome c synthase [Ascosphaera acerosa]|nr:holocytochrome c synthase [Ascosphaera acerosa]
MHQKDHGASPLNNPNSPFYIAPTSNSPPPEQRASGAAPPPAEPATTSWTSKLNPLNYMPSIANARTSPHQTVELDTERTSSSIPRSDPNEVWDYPSPQQMYNAVLRKGHTDTDPEGIPAMVAVHNWLNEGTWAEVERWDGVFRGRTLWQAWQLCARGKENVDQVLERQQQERERPLSMTDRGLRDKFSTTPPFDRHDWYVQRQTLRGPVTMRYVIDFYSLPPEPDGMPAFNVDVRPALDSPRAATERFIVWAGDLWWRASGGVAREAARGGREA